MKTACLFIALVCCASATGIMDIFAEVATTEYGKSLVANIQIQLESGANVDTLTSQMRGVANSLKEQFANAGEVHQAARDSCSADMTELASFLTQAEADHFEAANKGGLDTATLESRRAEIATKQGEAADRQAMFDSLEGQRAAETERFNAQIAEYRQVYNVLASVRDILTAAFGGDAEFLETKTSMKSQLLAKLTSLKTAEKGIAKAYNNFFQLMAKILSKSEEVHADTRVIDNILSICDRIEENIEMSEASERHAEAERAADYEELSGKVAGQIAWVRQALFKLAVVVRTLEARVSASNDKVAAAEATMGDYQARMQARAAECHEMQSVWENYSNNITAELATAAQVNYLLADQHARLARYGL